MHFNILLPAVCNALLRNVNFIQQSNYPKDKVNFDYNLPPRQRDKFVRLKFMEPETFYTTTGKQNLNVTRKNNPTNNLLIIGNMQSETRAIPFNHSENKKNKWKNEKLLFRKILDIGVNYRISIMQALATAGL